MQEMDGLADLINWSIVPKHGAATTLFRIETLKPTATVTFNDEVSVELSGIAITIMTLTLSDITEKVGHLKKLVATRGKVRRTPFKLCTVSMNVLRLASLLIGRVHRPEVRCAFQVWSSWDPCTPKRAATLTEDAMAERARLCR